MPISYIFIIIIIIIIIIIYYYNTFNTSTILVPSVLPPVLPSVLPTHLLNKFTTKTNPVYPAQIPSINNMWENHNNYPAVYNQSNIYPNGYNKINPNIGNINIYPNEYNKINPNSGNINNNNNGNINNNNNGNNSGNFNTPNNNKFSEFNYPGSIDNEISSLGFAKNKAQDMPAYMGFGFKDLAKNENSTSPEGNPFNLMNTSAPVAAPIKIDDEANADTIDFDEMNTYHAKWRNDGTRATAGIMNRMRDLDPFLREELDETENEVWWGQNEV